MMRYTGKKRLNRSGNKPLSEIIKTRKANLALKNGGTISINDFHLKHVIRNAIESGKIGVYGSL